MSIFSNFIILSTISLLDILIESFYQLFVLYFFDHFVMVFPNFKTQILDKALEKNLLASVRGSIIHLLINFTLIATVILFMNLMFNSNFKKSTYNIVKRLLGLFPAFHQITSFEMLILQTQCLIIRYFESRWIWNLFISEDSPFNRLWIVVVFSIWAPLEMRFKIFMEEKFHSNSVIIVGLVHALASSLYPYFSLFWILNFSNSKILEQIIRLNNVKNVSILWIISDSHHLKITPASFLSKNYFIVEGGHGLYDSNLTAMMLFDSYNFNPFYKLISFIMPFVVNMMFACLAIHVNKKYLKHLHFEDIHHITSYLVIEEFLNLGFYKYLWALYRGIEKLFILKNDIAVNKYLNSLDNKNELLYDFVKQEIECHRNVCLSPISIFFSKHVNTLNRIEAVFQK